MKAKLLVRFEKWANWKNILVLFILQMLFNLVFLPGASGSDAHNLPILDLKFFYTPAQAYEIIAAYTPAIRRAAALSRLTVDIIYPLVYGMLICLLLVVTFRRVFANDVIASERSNLTEEEIAASGWVSTSSTSSPPRIDRFDWVIFLPWGGVLFDYLENIGLASLYLSYPAQLTALAWLTAIFTALKWTLIGVAFLALLLGGAQWFKNR
ncbi:MAG: hypothetical protein Kow002_21660 [Anaerolineales bacterium]